MSHLSEQEKIRREKLQALEKLGISLYPADLYPTNTNTKEIKDNFKKEEKLLLLEG